MALHADRGPADRLGYSSVAQLGFITLGIFALNPQGAQGALLQMVNHGARRGAAVLHRRLLLAARAGSEDIREMGGIAFRAPVLATLFLIVTLATLAMPGSANFVGEFLILLGVFHVEAGHLDRRLLGRGDGQRLRAAPVSSARCTTASGRGRRRRASCALARRAGAGAAAAVIGFFALYPQLALKRSQRSVTAAVAAAQAQAAPALTAAADPGWTSYVPLSPGEEASIYLAQSHKAQYVADVEVDHP